jgi:hypothetical protein
LLTLMLLARRSLCGLASVARATANCSSCRW